ncbi:penicillin-binding protein [Enterococcus saccharolyticus]|uniref:penicillin-binding transpeptidase domain-containing protein n=1 Tax=Enterococcus saccharolyticus TaxID=41997 RepID=UPI001E3AEF2C|nr:penicillin-binding transpeptidase domain-containing protein [Enterococcus saccharolyticus]MCD5001791.1 penicillin-binding protein [Enterococcus saccharolyticus]
MRIIEKMKQYFKKKNLSTMNNRKKVGIILFTTSIGLFFLFVMRLSYIVIVGNVAGTSLEAKTEALYQGSEVIKAKRGTIYDRNGVAIAEDATSYSMYVVLNDSYVTGDGKILYAEKKNFEKIAEVVSSELDGKVKKKTVIETLQNASDLELKQTNIPNAKNITLQQKQSIEKKLEKQKLAGVYFDEHQSRIYPNGTFASHFIGYADVQTDKETEKEELRGKLGLELIYDDILKGKDGKATFQNDNYQNPLPGTAAEVKPAEQGKDVYTTLDSRLQSYLEQLMDDAWKDTKAQDLTAVLMEAKTGEIVAMSQRPSFNPETKEEFSDEDFIWENLFVQDKYEPGSTMKVFTTAAGIEYGVFDPNETYSTEPYKLYDATINDWDLGANHSVLTMRQALSWSSNIGMVRLEQKMPDRWQRYLKEFGFGRSTYSGLVDEKKGDLPEDNIVSQAMSSFGQAIDVTQFQMLQGFTAISNDGQMLKPQIVKKIVNPTNKEEIVTQPEVVGHPISANTAQTVREYMRATVEDSEYGTAYGAYELPGYHISAKTGTAEIAKDGNYLKGQSDYLYSIVTMFPSEDPKYVLYLTLKRPETNDTSAMKQIANPLMKRAMDLYDVDLVEGSNEVSTERVTVQDYRNLETDTAAEDAQKRGLSAIVIGNGDKIEKQSIKNGKKVMSQEKLLLLTNGENRYMPDVSGWSKADLIKLGELLDVKVTFEGEGYCVDQSVAAFEPLADQELTFTLQEN